MICLSWFLISHAQTLTSSQLPALLTNLLLIQSWIPDGRFYFSGNAVSWCLSCLLFYYSILPPLLRYRTYHKKSYYILLSCGVITYTLALFYIPPKYDHALFYINPLFRLPDFLIGIYSYKIYQRLFRCSIHNSIASYLQYGSILILMLILFTYLAPHMPSKIIYASYYWLPVAVFILIFASTEQQTTSINRFLKTKKLQMLGNLSFVFYMIHLQSIQALD